MVIAAHAIYILCQILLYRPPNLFSRLKIPLNAPVSEIRTRLALEAALRFKNHGTIQLPPLPKSMELLLSRLALHDGRGLFVRFGQTAIQTCQFCSSPGDYMLFNMPQMLLQYLQTAIVLLLLTTAMNGRERLRSLVLGLLACSALAEGYLIVSVSAVPLPRDAPAAFMWHDNLFLMRHVLFLVLPLLTQWLPPVYAPALLSTYLAPALAHLERAIPRAHLVRYTQQTVMREPELRDRVLRWWSRQAAEGEAALHDENVQRTADKLGLGFAKADGPDGGGEEGKLRLQARRVVETLRGLSRSRISSRSAGMVDKVDAATPDAQRETGVDEDAPGPPISVPDSADTGEGGKLKMIVQLVKKCLGVKDIAAMRLSLPASLLEPLPNLEYWHYLDRPDLFAAINDPDDAFERMLAVVRFTFTKDLKFVHGKVCKPYNSVLGEHFRTHWDVPPVQYSSDPSKPPVLRTHIVYTHSAPASTSALPCETVSIKSGHSEHSSKSIYSGLSLLSKAKPAPSTAPTSPGPTPDAGLSGCMSNLSLGSGREPSDHIRVVYITEQVSHHPPVSAYYASCPTRFIEMKGIDQISAKVSGTTLRVAPGSFNKGIFIDITGGPGEGERYHITHPVASVNGILRGSFYITVADSTIITCTGGNGSQRLRAVIEYKEESWIGKAHFLVEGVIHTYEEDEAEYEQWTKVKHVPQSCVIAHLEGCWKGHVRWRRTASAPASRSSISLSSSSEYQTLVDLAALQVVPKVVRPLEKQLPNESRKLWDSVTSSLLKKEYSDATKHKLAIEQRQRDEASERKRKGQEFIPRYFEKDTSSGVPVLTAAGWKAVEEEILED
ncbi:hypothetical protein ID866_7258 [Astraeus odoratus]|nr:hypothetical protein ID866_7258 [Astraeus odoratus]